MILISNQEKGYFITATINHGSYIPEALHVERIDDMALYDGDFEAACRRFYNENMLQKFLIRFLDEPCCAELNDALGRHDRDAAIKAVHTLTGQARSFGFIRLEKKSAALLQALRGNQDEEITELRYEVTTEYIRIVHAIRSLASELGIFM